MSLERGQLLYQQARYELAEQELRGALGQDPQHAYAHALLALTLMHRDQHKEATQEAQAAIHLAPDFAFAHYALSKVWYNRDHYDKSRAAIEEAIRLDPEDADYRFMLGAIHYDERDWGEALRCAEEGLRLDAENGSCTNLRAMALVKLGRGDEAGQTIHDALARDPENTATHANKGWALLHEGNANEALVHFREALRLNPHNEWARQGIVEAMKARNPIYSAMLRYFLWMSTLSKRQQWMVIFGGYFLSRITGLLGLWALFVLMTWTAEPLFNLVLRLDTFGRLALSREQVVESNWIGGVILGSLSSLVLYFLTKQNQLLMSALVFALLIIPVAGVFRAPAGWPRTVMMSYTGFAALLGAISMATVSFGPEFDDNPWSGLFIGFVVLAVFAGILVNFLVSQRVKK